MPKKPDFPPSNDNTATDVTNETHEEYVSRFRREAEDRREAEAKKASDVSSPKGKVELIIDAKKMEEAQEQLKQAFDPIPPIEERIQAAFSKSETPLDRDLMVERQIRAKNKGLKIESSSKKSEVENQVIDSSFDSEKLARERFDEEEIKKVENEEKAWKGVKEEVAEVARKAKISSTENMGINLISPNDRGEAIGGAERQAKQAANTEARKQRSEKHKAEKAKRDEAWDAAMKEEIEPAIQSAQTEKDMARSEAVLESERIDKEEMEKVKAEAVNQADQARKAELSSTSNMGINIGPKANDAGIDIVEMGKQQKAEEVARKAKAEAGLDEHINEIVQNQQQDKEARARIAKIANESVSNMGIDIGPKANDAGIDIVEMGKQEAVKAEKEAANEDYAKEVVGGMVDTAKEERTRKQNERTQRKEVNEGLQRAAKEAKEDAELSAGYDSAVKEMEAEKAEAQKKEENEAFTANIAAGLESADQRALDQNKPEEYPDIAQQVAADRAATEAAEARAAKEAKEDAELSAGYDSAVKEMEAEKAEAQKKEENEAFVKNIVEGMDAADRRPQDQNNPENYTAVADMLKEVAVEKATAKTRAEVSKKETEEIITAELVPESDIKKRESWKELEDSWKELGKNSVSERAVINQEIERQCDLSINALYGSAEKYEKWQREHASRVCLDRQINAELGRRNISAEAFTNYQREVFGRTSDNEGKDGLNLSREAFCGLSQQGLKPEAIRSAGPWEVLKNPLRWWKIITQGGLVTIPYEGKRGGRTMSFEESKKFAAQAEKDFKFISAQKESGVYTELVQTDRKEKAQAIEQTVLDNKLKEVETALAKQREEKIKKEKVEAAEKLPENEKLKILKELKKKWDETVKRDKKIREIELAIMQGKFKATTVGGKKLKGEEARVEMEKFKQDLIEKKQQASIEIINIAEKLSGKDLRGPAAEDANYNRGDNSLDGLRNKRLYNIALTEDVKDIFKQQVEKLKESEDAAKKKGVPKSSVLVTPKQNSENDIYALEGENTAA